VQFVERIEVEENPHAERELGIVIGGT